MQFVICAIFNVYQILRDTSLGHTRSKQTSNSSEDEIANVTLLYDDIVRVLQNTVDLCINSATDRCGSYVLECMFTKFSEITQCNGHYAVPRSFNVTDFGTNRKLIYDFLLLVINTNISYLAPFSSCG